MANNRSGEVNVASIATWRRVEHAYQLLKQEILDGRYPPGRRLVEADFAPRFGVSRSTLRMALVRLQQEGFVDLAPNKGASVRSLPLDEAAQMMEVREVLQALSARLAAERMTDQALAELGQITGDMARAGTDGDLMLYASLNARFHERIVELSSNPYIRTMLGQLSYPIIRFQFRGLAVSGRLQASLAEARSVLDALRRHDPDGAEEAMRAHLRRVREQMVHSGDPWTSEQAEGGSA